ncbi:D-alanyl-D-alanine carboxypeptidase family protein, partial [Clostridioides difficile]|nr:D-alanyl-D-alanine carboxypeptidase family protein [Clostridioides difficile]
ETNKTTEQDSTATEKPDNTETPAKPEQQPDENGYLPNQTLPTEPTYINGILLANKIYPPPSTFAPEENPEAREALNQM